MSNYEVIIIGGGPTGIALGMELGLHNIHTLILEKHAAPLLSPRAQLINARSMEFFMRWELDHILKGKRIRSSDFPQCGVWCSALNGKTYAVSDSNEPLNDQISPQLNIRIPLWLTEEVLRNKIKQFPCVHFLKQHEVIDIILNKNSVTVASKNVDHIVTHFKATYAVGCDGTNSITRQKMGIPYHALAPSKRVISVVFEVAEFEEYITISKGSLFFLVDNPSPAAIGSIDPDRGLWYAQIIYHGEAKTIEEIDIHHLIDDISGVAFPKKILAAHFWDMHIQVAEQFTCQNRVFLVGDSAHGFVPTGALGLNTGFGDVVNLGWKLSQVIRGETQPSLLSTYEQERYPICLNNLNISQRNADKMIELRKKHDPAKEPEAFAKASAQLARYFVNSLETMMGYHYLNFPLTQMEPQPYQKTHQDTYTPICAPGYFLPHIYINADQSIYHVLSPKNWTLIISEKPAVIRFEKWKEKFNQCITTLECLHLHENAYPSKYILIRPDWHIAFVGDQLDDKYLENFLKEFTKNGNEQSCHPVCR